MIYNIDKPLKLLDILNTLFKLGLISEREHSIMRGILIDRMTAKLD